MSTTNTTNTTTTLSPLDSQIIKDIGVLHFWYFDKTAFAENEIKYFVSEFEHKRADPLNKLNQSKHLFSEAVAAFTDCTSLLDMNFDTLKAQAISCTKRIEEQLAKESICQQERDVLRESRSPKESEEVQAFIAEQTALRKQIEADTEEKIKQLHSKYSSSLTTTS